MGLKTCLVCLKYWKKGWNFNVKLTLSTTGLMLVGVDVVGHTWESQGSGQATLHL